jgi:hypothetical protein
MRPLKNPWRPETSVQLKRPWGLLGLVKCLAYLAPVLSILFLASGCISKEEIEATLWKNNSPIPQEYCDQIPQLQHYGFYRILNNGKLEFMSFCNPLARRWFAIYDEDMKKILDRLTVPEDQEDK